MKFSQFVSVLMLAALASCSSTGSSSSSTVSPVVAGLLSSSQIQADITFSGAQVSGKVSSQAKSAIHAAAVDLLSLTSATVSAVQIDGIFSALKVQIPSADQPFVGLIVDGAALALDTALTTFGDHNVSSVAYASAVANGLLAAGF